MLQSLKAFHGLLFYLHSAYWYSVTLHFKVQRCNSQLEIRQSRARGSAVIYHICVPASGSWIKNPEWVSSWRGRAQTWTQGDELGGELLLLHVKRTSWGSDIWPGCLLLGTTKWEESRGRTRTLWRDYIPHQVWECLVIHQEDLREKVWNTCCIWLLSCISRKLLQVGKLKPVFFLVLIKQTRRDEVTRVSDDSLMQIKRIVSLLSGTPGEPQCHLALILDVLVFTRIQQSLVCTPASFLFFSSTLPWEINSHWLTLCETPESVLRPADQQQRHTAGNNSSFKEVIN